MLSNPIHVITNGDKKRLHYTKKALSNYKLKSKIFTFPRHPTNGKKGCFLSHIHLYKYAQQNDLEYIIICEDSIIHTLNAIPKKTQEEINILLNKPDWNIILLGGWFIPFTRFGKTTYSSIYKTTSIHGTSCYIIHKRLYTSILENDVDTIDEHIDRYLIEKAGTEAYIISPVIFTRNNIIPTTNTYFSNFIANIFYYINCSSILSNFWQYYAVHYVKVWIIILAIIIIIIMLCYFCKRKKI
jgi:GR25 family glycosyltransferase involved in LPS biosynthesis